MLSQNDREEIKQLFNCLDVDGDGLISLDAVLDLSRCLGQTIASKSVRDLYMDELAIGGETELGGISFDSFMHKFEQVAIVPISKKEVEDALQTLSAAFDKVHDKSPIYKEGWRAMDPLVLSAAVRSDGAKFGTTLKLTGDELNTDDEARLKEILGLGEGEVSIEELATRLASPPAPKSTKWRSN